MRKLSLSICYGLALILCQLSLQAQNCDQYNDFDIKDFRQKILSTPYISSDLQRLSMPHFVSEEYARQLLSRISIENPSFEQALQETAECWVTHYFSPRYANDLNKFENNAVLCFLMFNSRTLTISDGMLEEWTSFLEEMNDFQKQELQNILLEEFKQSHSREYLSKEMAFVDSLQLQTLGKNTIGSETNTPSSRVSIIVTTELPTETKHRFTPFQFGVSPADQVHSLELIVGDMTISSFEEKNGALIFNNSIELKKGENRIQIRCLSKDGQLFSESYTVTCVIEDYMNRRDRALLFAVDDYRKVANADNLENPVKDAEKFAKQLADYGFDTTIIKNPTRKEILSTLRQYGDSLYGEYDQLLVFFAGHGTIDKDTIGYIIPSDASSITDYDAFVDFNTLANRLDLIKCNHILFVCDACHSGAFRNVNKTRGSDNRNVVQEYNMKKYKSRLLLCSSTADETTYDKSKFMSTILKLLKDENNLCSYRNIVATLVKAKVKHESGSFGNGEPDGDFFFNKK